MKKLPIYAVAALVVWALVAPKEKPNPAPAPLLSQPAPVALPPSPPIAVTSTPITPKVAEAPKTTPLLRYIRGNKVALRERPKAKGRVLDRLNNGFEVYEEERTSGWIRVRHSISQQVGWVQVARVSVDPPKEEKEAPKKEPSKKEVLTKAAIVALLIERSVAEYRETRPCACPYNTDRSGRACGKRSAWSKPGGAKPLCYAGDVTEGMVMAYRP